MNIKNTITQVFLAAVVTGVALYFLYQTWKLSSTEGFGGAARGTGLPDCLRTSKDASEIYSLFSEKVSSTEEGPDDLRELTVLLSKISCLKKDLMSPSGIIEATRYQAYSTAHDIEPVAETAARCLAKTIPQRDLDIILEKWNTRGKLLIRKLCTNFKIKDADLKKVDKDFAAVIVDITDIAAAQCIKGEVKIMKGPRDVAPYEPPELSELREYKGYY